MKWLPFIWWVFRSLNFAIAYFERLRTEREISQRGKLKLEQSKRETAKVASDSAKMTQEQHDSRLERTKGFRDDQDL